MRWLAQESQKTKTLILNAGAFLLALNLMCENFPMIARLIFAANHSPCQPGRY